MNQLSPNNYSKNSLFPNRDIEPEDDDSWQISYLDILTILLGFLLIILSYSEIDEVESFSVSELFKSSSDEVEFITTPIENIQEELESLLATEIQREQLEIFKELNDLKIRFNSDYLYRSGSARLGSDATDILNRVLEAFKLITYNDFEIDIEGHTDDVPISSSTYNSNWELSTARASNIVKYFIAQGIDPDRLKVSGYADSRPLMEVDEEGNEYPASRDKNRRIALRLYYASSTPIASEDSLNSGL